MRLSIPHLHSHRRLIRPKIVLVEVINVRQLVERLRVAPRDAPRAELPARHLRHHRNDALGLWSVAAACHYAHHRAVPELVEAPPHDEVGKDLGARPDAAAVPHAAAGYQVGDEDDYNKDNGNQKYVHFLSRGEGNYSRKREAAMDNEFSWELLGTVLVAE